MPKASGTGLGRLAAATRNSLNGLAAAWQHEAAFRQEATLLAVLTPVALWLGQSPLERAALIGVGLLVLVVELVNSAVESTVDRFGDELHELSGRAKDLGSAAVLLSLLLVALVWGAVIVRRFGS